MSKKRYNMTICLRLVIISVTCLSTCFSKLFCSIITLCVNKLSSLQSIISSTCIIHSIWFMECYCIKSWQVKTTFFPQAIKPNKLFIKSFYTNRSMSVWYLRWGYGNKMFSKIWLLWNIRCITWYIPTKSYQSAICYNNSSR